MRRLQGWICSVGLVGLLVILLATLATPGCKTFGGPSSNPSVRPTDPNFASDTSTELGRKLIYQALQKLDWVGTLAIIVIVLGGGATVLGHSAGIKMLGLGFIGLAAYFAALRYSEWIALIGFVGAVCLVAYILLVRSRGWKETVASVNNLLDTLPKEILTRTNWTEPELRARMIEILRAGQPSAITRKLVQRFKSELKEQTETSAGWIQKWFKKVF